MKHAVLILVLLLPVVVFGQTWYVEPPDYSFTQHQNSRLRVSFSNYAYYSYFTYPGSGIYDGDFYGLSSSLWIGGIINGDTLVSTADIPTLYGAEEFYPDYPPSGLVKDYSPDQAAYPNLLYRPTIIYTTEYTDTSQYRGFVPFDQYDDRYHKPLGIKVAQQSRSYYYNYAEDFIITQLTVQNISGQKIDSLFLGWFHYGNIAKTGGFLPGVDHGDIEGYLDSVISEFPELGFEQIDVAWTADIDSRSDGDAFSAVSLRHVFGIAPIDVPDEANIRTFNWWVEEGTIWMDNLTGWGPRRRGTYDIPLRLFHGRQLGIPFTDNERYFLMANPEIDYMGYYAGTDVQGQGWMPPPSNGSDIADGHNVRFVTAVGPVNLNSGDKATFAFVFAIGENFHTQPKAFQNLFDPDYPTNFLRTLDQSDLVTNIRWAKRIYDNPGVDTDFDGDSGKFVWRYDAEYGDSLKVYYEGDGVPDFATAKPPPVPELRVYTEDNKIILRWNGRGVETFFDQFSSIRDFEGYRVYIARSQLESELILLSSYDKENYNRHKWNDKYLKYELTEVPFTLDSLKSLYGEVFDPLAYKEFDPFEDSAGTLYYFTKVDNNQSDLTDPTKIHKLYPDATKDTLDVDEEGRMRYYEYEYVIDNLLSTIPYYVSISSFDFGFPAKNLEPTESDPMENQVQAYAVGTSWSVDSVTVSDLNAYVYPNPYIADGRYRRESFENRFTDIIPDKSRAIYFANIPNRCTISIYSIDGDLIRKIKHDEPDGSGEAHIAKWDVINRNNMTMVPGLYYWVVESEEGNQIGKLTIIR